MSRFEGQTALVTGGARGIGAATAERLAAEGAHVVVADFDEAAAEETAQRIGGRAVRCDVTSRADVEAAVATAAETGRLDVLVTSAGITRDNLLHKLTDDDWEAVIATHLRGSFLAVQAAQAHMVEQRSGAIVLVSSVSALGNRGQANYSAAKAGIQGLTKTVALELGRFGIRANCVAPGFIVTAMTAQTAERLGVSFEDFQAAGAAQTPLGRVGQPEDVAGVVAFLCSEDAAYVSGQVIYVRGGPCRVSPDSPPPRARAARTATSRPHPPCRRSRRNRLAKDCSTVVAFATPPTSGAVAARLPISSDAPCTTPLLRLSRRRPRLRRASV